MTSFARAIELLGDPSGGYALTSLDVDGRLTTWGEAAERLTGYSDREVVGNPFSFLWSEPLDTESLQQASARGVFSDRAVLVQKGGEQFLAARRIAHVDEVGRRHGFLVAISPASSSDEPPVSAPTPARATAGILDSVVHPIFAAGLELNSLMGQLPDPSLRDRVVASIDHLDEALRNLRRVVVDAGLAAGPQS